MENQPLQQQARTRQVGLMDLFTMIAFFMPVVATTASVKRIGGGLIQYLLALPLGIVVGTLIVAVEWKLGKAIWLRFESYSEKAKNMVGLVLFVFQLFWIFVGLVSGDKMGALLVNHLAR